MGDAVDIVQLHRPIRQQPQRPLRMPRWRLGAAEGHEMSLELPVGLAQVDRTPALASAQRSLQTLLHEAALDPIHLALGDAQHLRDGLASVGNLYFDAISAETSFT